MRSNFVFEAAAAARFATVCFVRECQNRRYQTDADVDAARRVLEGLVMSSNDEVSPIDEATIARARASIAAGKGSPGQDAAARLRAKYG